jgi:hypothetical protein
MRRRGAEDEKGGHVNVRTCTLYGRKFAAPRPPCEIHIDHAREINDKFPDLVVDREIHSRLGRMRVSFHCTTKLGPLKQHAAKGYF